MTYAAAAFKDFTIHDTLDLYLKRKPLKRLPRTFLTHSSPFRTVVLPLSIM